MKAVPPAFITVFMNMILPISRLPLVPTYLLIYIFLKISISWT